MATSTREKESSVVPWIELTEKKQFSRLLYTNPVCFLSTVDYTATTKHKEDIVNKNDESEGDTAKEPAGVSVDNARNTTRPRRNVMVLTWLTATNNFGRFMFSLNRRRHTSSILLGNQTADSTKESCEFVLSVPVKGMEDLVRDVGHASGRWGSKFSDDYDAVAVENKKSIDATVHSPRPISKRQKKKMNRFAHGVAGLRAVPLRHGQTLGSSLEEDVIEGRSQPVTDSPFAVAGTVAHLKCRFYSLVKEPIIDDEHYLFMAEVITASVHPLYWDTGKNLFRPTLGSPPYLTFFGSQTFGFVSAPPDHGNGCIVEETDAPEIDIRNSELVHNVVAPTK